MSRRAWWVVRYEDGGRRSAYAGDRAAVERFAAWLAAHGGGVRHVGPWTWPHGWPS